MVEEAKARKELRMMLKEQHKREAARRTWAVVLVQARYRGRVGRWFARARSEVDRKTYDDLVKRRELMLQQHQARVALKRAAAASLVSETSSWVPGTVSMLTARRLMSFGETRKCR